VRVFETRSRADLEAILTGLSCPVVLVDPGMQVEIGLRDLIVVHTHAPDALVILNSAQRNPEVSSLARELGATHVLSGFVPPPDVAGLLKRWIFLCRRRIEQSGWTRAIDAESNLTEDVS